jgi:hypothetical protein
LKKRLSQGFSRPVLILIPLIEDIELTVRNLQFLNSCNRSSATNVDLLRRVGVTHVLNAAVGKDWIRYVDTSREYYHERKLYCEFYGIPAMDIMNYQLHPFFDKSNEFIESALEKNG